jgi:hypothetical protein
MKFEGWKRLVREYAAQFGAETPGADKPGAGPKVAPKS